MCNVWLVAVKLLCNVCSVIRGRRWRRIFLGSKRKYGCFCSAFRQYPSESFTSVTISCKPLAPILHIIRRLTNLIGHVKILAWTHLVVRKCTRPSMGEWLAHETSLFLGYRIITEVVIHITPRADTSISTLHMCAHISAIFHTLCSYTANVSLSESLNTSQLVCLHS